MDAYESINNILVHLFNDIWELEEKAVITEEFKDLTNNDMHIIEAIGLGRGNNMSTIAKKLGITVGSLTTSMNSLVNKKYAVRHRSEEDRRIVNIQLTEKGEKAYHHHANYISKEKDPVIDFVPEMLVDEARDLLRDLGIPRHLADVGVTEDKIELMAADAMKSGNIMANPRQSTIRDIIELYKKAM